MFEESAITPAWSDLDEPATLPAQTRRENAEERVRLGGPGLELLRRVHIERLRGHMEAFYEHGTVADVLAFCAAFDLRERGWREQAGCKCSQASLLEALLAVLGLPPRKLLQSRVQRAPRWPV